eukprot:631383-Amphidinium_carterae.1
MNKNPHDSRQLKLSNTTLCKLSLVSGLDWENLQSWMIEFMLQQYGDDLPHVKQNGNSASRFAFATLTQHEPLRPDNHKEGEMVSIDSEDM